MKKLSPFDFLNSINAGGKPNVFAGHQSHEDGLDHESPSRAYVPFIINRGLSYFRDTVLIANVMNQYSNLAPKMQYDFLSGMIHPRKRFSKWTKAEDDSKEVKAIMTKYGYSSVRAREALTILKKEEVAAIIQSQNRGGK